MSVEGTWNITIKTPMGPQSVRLEIAVVDGQVRGTAAMGGDRGPFQEPELQGNRLRWSQDTTKPMKLTIKFDVTIDGDSLKGTAKAGMFPGMEVTGERA